MSVAVKTHHMDNGRTGANLSETVLTPARVRTGAFGKLWRRAVRGAVYAQPLYVPGVKVRGRGVRNVLYIATMNNYVYAFDADDPNAAPIWGPVWLGPAIRLPDDKVGGGNGYRDISAQIGIIGTPVASTTRGALYVVAATKEGRNYHHKLHALNLATGHEMLGGPVAVPNSRRVPSFRHHLQNQRPALLHAHDQIFIAFAAYADHTDTDTYHGWVFSYDAATLHYRNQWVTTPHGSEAGIWQAGQGPAAADGRIYVMTGNGDSNDDGSELGCAFVELDADTLKRTGWFAPTAWKALSAKDWDLGSAGVLVLPGTDLIIGGSKTGTAYVLRRGALPDRADDGSAIQVFQAAAIKNNPVTPPGISYPWHHIHGSPVFWEHGDSRWIYLGAESDFIKAFELGADDRFLTDRAGTFSASGFTTPPRKGRVVSRSNITTPPGSMPGAMLSLSANGSDPKSGVLWASFPSREDANQNVVDGELCALDPTDLTRILWRSKDDPARDDVGPYPKFCPPVPVEGRVYLPSLAGPYNKCMLGETTIAAPALASIDDDRLIVGWTGTDDDHSLNVAKSAANFESDHRGLHFVGKKQLGETSDHGPAVACGDGRLFLAWTGTDDKHRLNLMQSADATRFTGKVTFEQTSTCGPALAFFRGRLYIAWVGTDEEHRLNIAYTTDYRTLRGKKTLNESSHDGPSLAVVKNRLYLLWRGTDRGHELNLMSSAGGATWGGKLTFHESSDYTPAMTPGEALNLVWTGRDDNRSLNLLASDSDGYNFDDRAKQTYRDSSSHGIAMTAYRGRTYVSWAGTDNPSHVNVAAITAGQVSAYGPLSTRSTKLPQRGR